VGDGKNSEVEKSKKYGGPRSCWADNDQKEAIQTEGHGLAYRLGYNGQRKLRNGSMEWDLDPELRGTPKESLQELYGISGAWDQRIKRVTARQRLMVGLWSWVENYDLDHELRKLKTVTNDICIVYLVVLGQNAKSKARDHSGTLVGLGVQKSIKR
jgi:hypothetical protein